LTVHDGQLFKELSMQVVRIGHSPDPDDAFMFYALTAGKVKIDGVQIEHLLEDIESLNRRARTGELEVTAVSAATYVLVADQYRMMDPGASMGKGYGPILVAREPIDVKDIPNKVVAIPGSHTTASLLLRMFIPEEPALIEVAFDKIPQAVLDGQADLGLLIHEGQITYQKMGLVKVMDFGEVWQRETGLPLPLGVNVMRRDLGDAMHRKLSQGLRDSIAWAHANVDEAVEYSMRYGRGIDKETATRFVLMYVNDYTVKLGDEGMAALKRLFTDAHKKKLIPAIPPLDAV
jgi:1,4-dihydroxy-6-naphthoate synthase